MERAIAQEAQNLGQEAQNQGEVTEEQRKKDQEEIDNENQGQDPAQDRTENLPSTSRSILTGGHLRMVELGLVPFTPSKHHEVACLENVYFDPKGKSIVLRIEKTLKMGIQPKITIVTEKMVVKYVEEDPKQIDSMGIATAHENAHNISKLMETLDQYKGKMVEMKEVLRKEERVGR